MNRLRRELGVVPRAGITASAVLALLASLLWALVAQGFPLAARIALSGALALFVFLYGLLVAYVYGDAKRRGMRHRLWTLVAALAPNALGFIAYFLLRDPLVPPCGACGATARRELAFCPQCGAPRGQACPACRRPLERVWTHCGHCGAPIPQSAVAE